MSAARRFNLWGKISLRSSLKVFIAFSLLHDASVRAQISPASLPDLKLAGAGTVNAMVFQEDGKIIIGGEFNAINGVPRRNLARLNPNGSVDATWIPTTDDTVACLALNDSDVFVGLRQSQNNVNALLKISRTGNGQADTNWFPNPNGDVRGLALLGTNLYAAGFFQSIGGLSRTGLAKINIAGTGAGDPTWTFNVAGSGGGVCQAMALSGTNLYVGGRFQKIGSSTKTNLARIFLSISGTGTVDNAWIPNPVSAFFLDNNEVTAIAVSETNVFIGGTFQKIGGQNRTNLAKLTTTGSGAADASWTPGCPNSSSFISALAVNGTNLYVGGYITCLNGQSRTNIARLRTTGTGVTDATWTPIFDSNVQGITPNGSEVYVCGIFRLVNGSVSLGMAKLDSIAGRLDPSFHAQVQRPGIVYAAARQADGKIVVGGSFWSAGDLPRENIARVTADGTLDTTWAPFVDDAVIGIAVNEYGIYIRGSFLSINGVSRTKVAKLFVNSDGFDASWNPNPSQGLSDLALSGTNVFVCGDFFSIGGTNRSKLVKLNGNGMLDPQWVANPTGSVSRLLISGTNLYVAGTFNQIGGVTRTNLALLSTEGTGAVNATWNPNSGLFVPTSLALDTNNLFIGGRFTNSGDYFGIRRVSRTGSGLVDASYGVTASDFPLAMSISGTNIYVTGSFNTIGGLNRKRLARVRTTGTGTVDTNWNPNLIFPVINQSSNIYMGAAMALSPVDVYLCGSYEYIEGLSRNGFAFLTVADAPVLIPTGLNSLVVARNASDGSEITHFRIVGITGAVNLFLSDGVTPVQTNDFITAAQQGAAGLIRGGGTGTVTVVSALNNTPAGAGTASTTINLAEPATTGFALAKAAYSINENSLLTVAIRKLGTGTGSVSYATANGSAIGGPDYQIRSGTLNFSLSDTQKNLPAIAIGNDFEFNGDRVFYVNISNAVGGVLVNPTTATITIIDDDGVAESESFLTNAPPNPLSPPVSNGVMKISLQPTNAGGQWRLLGELNWHDSDATISGLVTGNYGVEFRPVNDYRQPDAATLPVIAGQTNSFTFNYAATSTPETGDLTTFIEPDDVATNATVVLRGQWRRIGEVDWHDSGEVQANLNTGSYSVEYKPVSGRLTPTPQLIQVGAAAEYAGLATYLVGPNVSGAITPTVVPFNTAATNSPYRYNGQLQTTLGFGSGVVVKQRVVLTAAHVLFDDVSLKYTTVARWFFQRYRDQIEPVPLTPRGWYVFDGYASQRQLDNSPGISTPESQNLDIAAVYFIEDAGRGGFGGFLASEATDNEFLLGADNKFLAGYPLDGVADGDKGKLFATTPTNVVFSKSHDQIYSTTQIASYPGNSGGPLYVQNTDGIYYPAGIFLGGSGQTLVRAINGEVVDLINRAEVSGNGGGNSTGGGVITVSPGQTAAPIGSGLLTVNLNAANAANPRPGWRITGLDTNFFSDPLTTVALIGGGNYPVEFKPIPGFITPSNRTITIAVGGLVTIQGNYIGIRPQLILDRANGLTLTGGGTGATYRVEFATNFPQAVWSTLTSFTLINTSFPLSNTVPPTNSNRFYRAVLVP